MDDVAEKNLSDVKNEDCEPETLSHGLDVHEMRVCHNFTTYRVRAVEVRTATVGDDGNSESPTNNDDRTGNKELDGLMSLEPTTGRGPEVTSDQSTQGQEKQKSENTENPMSDDHSVGLSQGE